MKRQRHEDRLAALLAGEQRWEARGSAEQPLVPAVAAPPLAEATVGARQLPWVSAALAAAVILGAVLLVRVGDVTGRGSGQREARSPSGGVVVADERTRRNDPVRTDLVELRDIPRVPPAEAIAGEPAPRGARGTGGAGQEPVSKPPPSPRSGEDDDGSPLPDAGGILPTVDPSDPLPVDPSELDPSVPPVPAVTVPDPVTVPALPTLP